MNFGTDTHPGKDKRPSAATAAVRRAEALSLSGPPRTLRGSHGTFAAAGVPRRMLVAVLGPASALALIAALVLAIPAHAGLGDFRTGVVSGSTVGAPDLTRMDEAGVKSLRVPFNWNGIETQRRPVGGACSDAEYGGFARYDAMVEEAGRQGIKVLPILFGSPTYVRGGDFSNMPRTGTREMGDYNCYVRALVRRYGRGGTFSTTNLPAQPITDWQVWNEQNLPNYAAGERVSPKEYARFLKATTAAVRGIDPNATIVLGGMPEATSRGMNANTFLRGLYRVRRIESKFDVVALHPYARNARGVRGALVRVRETLRDVGDRRQVLWLTEVGYASSGPKGHFLVDTEQGQAEKLTSTLQLIRKNRKRYKVGTVHWYSWRDTEPYAARSNEWFDYAGLYKENGLPKPSCNAYARFTGGRRPCRSIPAPTSEPLAGSLPVQADAGIIPSPPPGE